MLFSAGIPQPVEIDQGIADLSNGSGCGFTLSHHRGICVTRFPGNVSGLESGVMEVERGLLVELLGSPRCGFTLTGPDRPSKYGKLRLHSTGRTRTDIDPRLKLGFRGWISLRLCMQVGIGGGISGDATRSHMMPQICKTENATNVGSRKAGMAAGRDPSFGIITEEFSKGMCKVEMRHPPHWTWL